MCLNIIIKLCMFAVNFPNNSSSSTNVESSSLSKWNESRQCFLLLFTQHTCFGKYNMPIQLPHLKVFIFSKIHKKKTKRLWTILNSLLIMKKKTLALSWEITIKKCIFCNRMTFLVEQIHFWMEYHSIQFVYTIYEESVACANKAEMRVYFIKWWNSRVVAYSSSTNLTSILWRIKKVIH